jgi:hypothetical protein
MTNAPSGQRRSTGAESANGAHVACIEFHACTVFCELVSNTISKSVATRAEWYLRGRSLLVQHEPCGFVRKGNAPERPGRRNLHNLGVPISKSSWVDRTRRKYDHPAQKPADPVRRPSSNRTRRATGDGQALETDGRTFTRGAEGNLRNLKLRCVLARSKWRGSARRCPTGPTTCGGSGRRRV